MAMTQFGQTPDTDLRTTMLNRAMLGPNPQETGVGTAKPEDHPTAPTGLPAHTPNEPSKTPPAWQRYLTSLHMQHAFANGWQPNPMIIRLLEGK